MIEWHETLMSILERETKAAEDLAKTAELNRANADEDWGL